MDPTPPADRWTVVVPLKSSARGKSRIEVDPLLRRRLVLAMALDTVAAAVATAGVVRVLAVVDDPDDGELLAEVDGVLIHRTTATGLNGAIADGLASAGQGVAAGHVAILPADLPSLTAVELGGGLQQAALHRFSVVADRQGTGTTLLAAATGRDLQPHYGAGSLRRHRAAGAVPLDLPQGSGLRRDVDHAADLAGATGPRTLALLTSAGLVPASCGAGAARPAG
jgi:2-phospho-L-lactate guanylyltransferase